MKAALTSNLALAALAIAFLGLVRLSPAYDDFANRGFDLLSTTAQPIPDEPGVVLVAIDEPSFSEIGLQWPWPRDIHAALIESLRAAGVKAIAMDVVFAESSDPELDAMLALAAGPDVVFAADEIQTEESYGETLIRTEPLPQLLENGALSGLASVGLDGDGVVRSIPPYDDSLARQLLGLAGEEPRPTGARARIQYFGPSGSYPRISYYQALDPETFLPPDFLRGAVVIVGYNLQASPEVGDNAIDVFQSPYTLSTRQLMPGPEIHATIYDNLREGLAISQPPALLGWIMLVLGALGGLGVSRPGALWKRMTLSLGGIIIVVLGGWLTLRFGRLWVSPLDPVLGLGLTTLAIGVRDFASEQRRRREVQSAFAQYISPVMVERLIAQPDLLQLGGERKELTVMFSDIRGFTAISEAMSDRPEDLVQLINDILTPISEIVIEHGGTIDKYMGDCIMAFWNAPLDDPDHAQSALRAAQAMLAAMSEVNRRVGTYLPDGKLEVRMGIGINTGLCVVGNMGSEKRFDYSVLGDAVNTASRLEGQCKELGVPIVIGEATARSAGDKFALKSLGKVSLRGKASALEVYTLREDT